MKNILIVLLGNRDLQIHRSHKWKFPEHYDGLWIKNNDSPDYFTIHTRHDNQTFLNISEKIDKEYNTIFRDAISFPIVEEYIKLLPKEGVEKIIFTTSKQAPLDKQDCYHVGNIANTFYNEKQFVTEFRPFSCNPTHFGELVNFYLELFNEYQDYKIIFGNSGGTPDMRAATYFAGIFRNIEFITINAREKQPNKNNFKHQERLILRHTVKEMLKAFDYEGISKLPINVPEIQAMALYAQARISLNFEKAKEYAARFNDVFFRNLLSEVDKTMTIKELERETYFSAKIKYAQGSYSDYLWRLFTIHENMFIPLTENCLGGVIRHGSWNTLLNQNRSLISYLNSIMIRGRRLRYDEPNKFVYKAIIDFYLPANHPNKILLDTIDRCLKELGAVRNDVAHNYKGIGLDNIINALPIPHKLDFNDMLSQYVGEIWSDFGIYQKINEEILRRFEI